jgi:hypothetical protein
MLLTVDAHPGPVELVLAGDFFDFLRIARTPGGEDRASATIDRPEYRELFATLARFAAGEAHTVIYLPGNHDADIRAGVRRRSGPDRPARRRQHRWHARDRRLPRMRAPRRSEHSMDGHAHRAGHAGDHHTVSGDHDGCDVWRVRRLSAYDAVERERREVELS